MIERVFRTSDGVTLYLRATSEGPVWLDNPVAMKCDLSFDNQGSVPGGHPMDDKGALLDGDMYLVVPARLLEAIRDLGGQDVFTDSNEYGFRTAALAGLIGIVDRIVSGEPVSSTMLANALREADEAGARDNSSVCVSCNEIIDNDSKCTNPTCPVGKENLERRAQDAHEDMLYEESKEDESQGFPIHHEVTSEEAGTRCTECGSVFQIGERVVETSSNEMQHEDCKRKENA